MPKFNIFKLDKRCEKELFNKFASVGLEKSKSEKIENFDCSLYFSKEPDPIKIWWVKVYKKFLPKNKTLENKSYFAAFILSSKSALYGVSLGKSHFYLKGFCDTDFGIHMAERIADKNTLKLKNSRMFGGKKNKMLISYIKEGSEIDFESGEALHFLKAKTIDKNLWGTTASFGHSIQLNLGKNPDELPCLLKTIEETLKKEPIFSIPSATVLSDKKKILVLDEKLCEAILNDGGDIETEETTVSGVDFLFLDKCTYQFKINRKLSASMEGLTVTALRGFIQEEKIDLQKSLNQIKVQVKKEDQNGFEESLKYFLSFQDNERHCLLDGKWHVFNQNYLEFLKKQLNKLPFENQKKNYSKSEYEKWHQEKIGQTKILYPEAFFNEQREKEGYINLDRDLEQLKNYKIEKLDLFKNDTAFFVKIGSPKTLGYAIDQAMATTNVLKTGTSLLKIAGQEIVPKNICLWLIFSRKREINKLSDINSLIFLIKLAEWARQCWNAGFNPQIWYGFKED